MAFFVRASKGNGVDTAITFSGPLGPQPDLMDIDYFPVRTRISVTEAISRFVACHSDRSAKVRLQVAPDIKGVIKGHFNHGVIRRPEDSRAGFKVPDLRDVGDGIDADVVEVVVVIGAAGSGVKGGPQSHARRKPEQYLIEISCSID